MRSFRLRQAYPNVQDSHGTPLSPHAFLFRAPSKKRAKEQVVGAQRQGIPLTQLSGRPSGRQILQDAQPSQRSLSWAGSIGDDESQATDAAEEGGEPGARRRSTRLNMKKIAECREKSQSAWLHFPHVELVFLLFAFEGAVASQVSALRENDSSGVFFLAMASLVCVCFPTCRALYSGLPRQG